MIEKIGRARDLRQADGDRDGARTSTRTCGLKRDSSPGDSVQACVVAHFMARYAHVAKSGRSWNLAYCVLFMPPMLWATSAFSASTLALR